MQENPGSASKAENSFACTLKSAEKSPVTGVRAATSAPAPQERKAKQGSRQTASKSDRILKLLRQKNGATIEALSEATGWQAHSVRGFLSGTVRKKLSLSLVSETGKDGKRRYRIATSAVAEVR